MNVLFYLILVYDYNYDDEIVTCAVSPMTVKSDIYFPYISFSFEHDNSKFMKQICISRKNTFICLISSNVLQDLFVFELVYFTTIDK